MALIPAPVLDPRDEEQIAAEMIAHVSGGLTAAAVEKGIAVWLRLREMVAAGNLPAPASPELTNANPSSPHTALIEAMAMLAAYQSFKLNLLPDKVRIEFHRLFGATLREAQPATTTLRFVSGAPAGVGVTVPAGTLVSDAGGAYQFTTDEELFIPAGEETGEVAATRTAGGALALAIDTLTTLSDPVAFVAAVRNPEPVDSGADAETIEEALARAVNYQRRAERIVTARDLEEAILEDVLLGNGVVRAFEQVKDGDWGTPRAGYTTVVVMTRAGGAVGAEQKAAIRELLSQAVGAPFIYVKDPVFRDFQIEADVLVNSFTTQAAVVSAVRANLEAFYSASEGNFGRSILRSEIITVIEGTQGVKRIEPQPGGEILAAPLVDSGLAPYELPRVTEITINVVQ
ncbi:MAG TPA: baseplate J/gp47 family protein [Pyrinomonadaceae bacterium]